jgi:hypothetical protein
MVVSSNMQTQSLIRMLNGRDFLSQTSSSQGQVFQFASAIDPTFTNFPRQAIFVPTLYNIALMSRPPMRLYYTAGRNEAIRINHMAPAGDKVFRIRSLEGNFEIIPEHSRLGASVNIFVNNQLTQAGNYMLFSEKDPVTGLSFNFDRKESDPACFNTDQLDEMLTASRLTNFSVLKTGHKPVNEILREMNYGRQLWKYFVWLALLALLAEVVLLRIWKN